MATTYKKGKLQKHNGANIEVRYPETTLDKVVAWVNGSTAGVTILDGGRIKPDYLPSSAVYTSGGKIDSGVIPQLTTSIISGGTFTSAFLPSNVVYTSGGKIESSVVPSLSATIISGGTFATTLLPTIPVNQIAVSGGTINSAILPAIPAANISGTISKTNLPGSVDDIVELKAVSASAPDATGVAIGDQYFNTTDGVVMTAVSAGTWAGATSEDPVDTVIYFVPSTTKSYRWGGSAMLEIAAQRAVTTTVGDPGSDDLVPTEKAVRTAINTYSIPMASYNGSTAGGVYLKNTFSSVPSEGEADTFAVTPRAVDNWVHQVLANQVKGMGFDTPTSKFYLYLGDGLVYNENTISLNLSAGYGIVSVSGGTITAELEWQAD